MYPLAFLVSQQDSAIGKERGQVVQDTGFEIPGSNLPPCYYLDLFSVHVGRSSTPRPHCVKSQLVSLPPVGTLNLNPLAPRQTAVFPKLVNKDTVPVYNIPFESY